MGNSGQTSFDYEVSVSEFKKIAGRQRFGQSSIEECENFFRGKGLVAEYNAESNSIDISLDLNNCKFNARQAKDFSTAQDYHFSNS